MASRYFSPFKGKKIGPPGPRPEPGPRAGTAVKTPTMLTEKTAAWPDVEPYWKGSFNRKTKAHVIKTRAAKKGID